jgi:hypothetical protein
MFATIRRFEGVDKTRTDEIVNMVDETLTPRLSQLPGFESYYLVDCGNGVMTSVSCFDTSEHAEESTKTSSAWVKEHNLESAIPNAPKITSGEIVAQKAREFVKA